MSVNSALILSIIGDAITIVGFAINLHFSKQSKVEKWRWVIIAIAIAISFGFTVYNSSKLLRIKNIHRQASAICEHYYSSYSDEFIQESLVFLEENSDVYPKSYSRAEKIYSDMNNSIVQYDFETARKLYGIIKGIATLNDDK